MQFELKQNKTKQKPPKNQVVQKIIVNGIFSTSDVRTIGHYMQKMNPHIDLIFFTKINSKKMTDLNFKTSRR